MIRKLNLLIILLLISTKFILGQQKKVAYYFTPDTTVVKSIFPSVGWDTRFSFIEKGVDSFKGVRVGVRFGKNRNRLTVAYRWFSFEENIGLLNYKNLRKLINPRYFSEANGYFYVLSYQHIALDTYRFAIGVTTDIGLGASYEDSLPLRENINIFKRNNKFVPIQLGVYTEFKATRFVGVTALAGYRWVDNYRMQPSINKMYLGLGARLYVGSLLRHFKSRRSINKHI